MNLGDLALHKISGGGGINLTGSIQPVIFIQTDEPIATKKGDIWVNASFVETGNFYYSRNKPTGTFQDNDIWVNISGLRTYITMKPAVDFILSTGSPTTNIVGDDLLAIHESTQEANKLVTLWKNAIARIQGKFDRLYRYSTAENDWLSVESFYWDGGEWIKFSANSAGDQWFQATDRAGWTGRSSHTSVVFDNKMWVMGGSTGTSRNDVWYSSDGVSWIQATDRAGWVDRYNHTSVVFDNKMWVIGGHGGDIYTDNRSDVWYSSNGSSWTQATSNAGWDDRSSHTSVVFKNRMWVMGGYVGNNNYDYGNDVWYSSNGTSWTQATSRAGWASRRDHTSVVFDNKMWVIGGWTGGVDYRKDVWYSSNGTSWTQATSNAGWTGKYEHASVVFDNKMWVIGGRADGYSGYNDVWYSSNGSSWTQATDSAGWTARRQHTSVVFDNKMWVIGGITDSGRRNDVWYSY